MTIKTLYQYNRNDGGTTVSPIAPNHTDYTMLLRLVADEGNVLTNGVITTEVIDTDNISEWQEIEMPKEKEKNTEDFSNNY